MSKKMNYHELAKNDPNFHDVRAKILLEAAHHIKAVAVDQPFHIEKGMWEAAAELKRMASNARRSHNKHQDVLRKQREASEAKAKAFEGEVPELYMSHGDHIAMSKT